MRFLIGVLVLSEAAFGQGNPKNFKTPLNDSDYGVASDAITGDPVLASSILAGATSFTLSNGSGWIGPVFVGFDVGTAIGEIRLCTTVSGNAVSGCQATAHAHAAGLPVKRIIAGDAWNQLAANVKYLTNTGLPAGTGTFLDFSETKTSPTVMTTSITSYTNVKIGTTVLTFTSAGTATLAASSCPAGGKIFKSVTPAGVLEVDANNLVNLANVTVAGFTKVSNAANAVPEGNFPLYELHCGNNTVDQWDTSNAIIDLRAAYSQTDVNAGTFTKKTVLSTGVIVIDLDPGRLQGSDPNVMTSGTISGGAGTSVCLDSLSGLTTIGCPSGGGGGGGLADPGANGIIKRTAVNVTGPATATDSSALEYVGGGGVAQAQTVALSPAVLSLTAGLTVKWLPVAANTGAGPTLQVNSTAATTITKCGATALVASDLTTAAIAVAVYDGTRFQLINPQSATCGGGGVGGGGVAPSIFDTASNIGGHSCSGTNSGQFYIPNGTSDLMGMYGICDGSTWDWYFRGISVSPPTTSIFTGSLNAGQNAAISAGNPGVLWVGGNPGSGSWTLRGKSVSSFATTQTIIAGFLPQLFAPTNTGAYNGCGIYFTDGTTLFTIGAYTQNNSPSFLAVGLGSTTTATPQYNTAWSGIGSSAIWIKVTGSGTFTISVSLDHKNWIPYLSSGWSNYVTTPTTAGIWCSDQNYQQQGPTVTPNQMHVIDWSIF